MIIEENLPRKLFLPEVQQKIGFENQITPQNSKFSDTLNGFINDVDSLQKESASMTEKFIKGEPVDIHDVMISAEKAKTSFQLLMEIRNKFLDLYKEVLRMQV
ncbi:MAG: flagellar hook-basal body complex protein FliE [Candidatus Kapabacteria bacterium]|nr:flagellar hook-basal body complex protein FliE [Candidatus Kapabacteria bacterium]